MMPLTKAEIARLRSLQDKKHRENSGLFVVEGEKVIDELLAAHFAFEEIYTTDSTRPPPARQITAAEMVRISHYPTPSRVLAVGRTGREPLPDGALNRGLTLALDGIQDPGNVGTLLRVADWFAFDRVLLSPDCADVFAQKVINASMGSFARVTVHVVDLPRAFADTNAEILGCDLRGDDVHAAQLTIPAVVVVGSEGRGISEAVAAKLTRRITIPRYGHAESLNAAIAAAIVCDNLRRSLRPSGAPRST